MPERRLLDTQPISVKFNPIDNYVTYIRELPRKS